MAARNWAVEGVRIIRREYRVKVYERGPAGVPIAVFETITPVWLAPN